VLRVERVGSHDNFFDLGGSSILLTTLQSRLAGELGMAIPLRRLFELPTVAAFALALEREAEPAAAEPARREALDDRASRARQAREALRQRRQDR
jgi:hypothetical protein